MSLFQPTFTQGLVVGQLSIIFLLAAVLKYFFLESPDADQRPAAYHEQVDADALPRQRALHTRKQPTETDAPESESTEWFNTLLKQIVDVYRSKLRDDVEGVEGDEISRKRIENFANSIRPAGFMDHITVHSVNLGVSAPRLFNARLKSSSKHLPADIEFDAMYTDTISLSLSTSYLFNYPMTSFARLPISLTISLSQFKSSISVLTPQSASSPPVLTLMISPNFVLDLTTTSLMGSRAKLANVPKLHELIQHQVRRVLAARATWQVVLPGLATVTEVKKELQNT